MPVPPNSRENKARILKIPKAQRPHVRHNLGHKVRRVHPIPLRIQKQNLTRDYTQENPRAKPKFCADAQNSLVTATRSTRQRPRSVSGTTLLDTKRISAPNATKVAAHKVPTTTPQTLLLRIARNTTRRLGIRIPVRLLHTHDGISKCAHVRTRIHILGIKCATIRSRIRPIPELVRTIRHNVDARISRPIIAHAHYVRETTSQRPGVVPKLITSDIIKTLGTITTQPRNATRTQMRITKLAPAAHHSKNQAHSKAHSPPS